MTGTVSVSKSHNGHRRVNSQALVSHEEFSSNQRSSVLENAVKEVTRNSGCDFAQQSILVYIKIYSCGGTQREARPPIGLISCLRGSYISTACEINN